MGWRSNVSSARWPLWLTAAGCLCVATIRQAAGDEWTALGPRPNVELHALAMDPRDSRVIYAIGGSRYLDEGGFAREVCRSEDAGQTWAPIAEIESEIHTLIVNPMDPQVLYAVSGYYEVYKSDDGGEHWVSLGPFSCLAIDPGDTQTLYAMRPDYGESAGVYKSQDQGASWVATGLMRAAIYSLTVDPKDSRIVYAGTPGGEVYRSDDGGTAWTASRVASGSAAIRVLAVDPQTAGVVYAGGDSGVYRSTDGGRQWSPFGDNRSPTITVLIVDPSNSNIVYAGMDTVYKTEDGGKSWVALPLPPTYSLAMDPHDPQTLYATAGARGQAGLYKSEDGGRTWSDISSEEPSSPFLVLGLEVDAQHGQTVYAEVLDMRSDPVWETYASDDGGTTWKAFGGLWTVASSPVAPQTLYGGADGGVGRSTDGGLTWVDQGLDDVEDLALDPQNPDVVYALSLDPDEGGVYRSEDGGEGWTHTGPADLEIYPDDFGDLVLGKLTMDLRRPSALYMLYVVLGEGAFGEAYRTLDGGESWTLLPLDPWSPVFDLAIAPDSGQRLYAAGGDAGVLLSEDSGDSWSAIGADDLMAGFVCLAVAIDPQRPQRVCAGGLDSESGAGQLYRTEDGGSSWTAIGDRLVDPETGTTPAVWSLAFTPGDPGKLYAGTSAGVFVTASSPGQTTAVEGAGSGPALAWLGQNYPNPFNSATAFRYSVDRRDLVQIEVLGVSGQRVRRLVEGIHEPGVYQTTWDGRDDEGRTVATGTYVVRLLTGTHRQSRKATMTK